MPGVLAGSAALLTAAVAVVGLLHAAGVGSRGPASGLPTPSSTLGGETGTPGNGAPSDVVFHGRLSMRLGDLADLTHGLVGNGLQTNDIGLSDIALYATSGAFLAPTTGPGTRTACSAALSGHNDRLESLSGLDNGSWVCVHTHNGHVAAVQVVSLVSQFPATQIVLDCTVWQ